MGYIKMSAFPVRQTITGSEFIISLGGNNNVKIPISAIRDYITDGIGFGFIGNITPSSPNPGDYGIYVPTQSGTYVNFDNIVVELSDGLTLISQDRNGAQKITVPIDLSGYQPQTLLQLHTEWVYDWMAAAAGRDYTYNEEGYFTGGEIRWIDGVFGEINNVTIVDGRYTDIRFNRPAGENRYITLRFEYDGDTITRVRTEASGY